MFCALAKNSASRLRPKWAGLCAETFFEVGVPNDSGRGVFKKVGLVALGSAVFQVTRGS